MDEVAFVESLFTPELRTTPQPSPTFDPRSPSLVVSAAQPSPKLKMWGMQTDSDPLSPFRGNLGTGQDEDEVFRQLLNEHSFGEPLNIPDHFGVDSDLLSSSSELEPLQYAKSAQLETGPLISPHHDGLLDLRKGRCYVHGGIRKCQTDGCEKKDRGNGFCISHGGGKRCVVPGCTKSVRRGQLCQVHEDVVGHSSRPPTPTARTTASTAAAHPHAVALDVALDDELSRSQQELSGSSSAGAAPAVRRAASETAALRQLPRRGHDDDAQSDGGGHYVAVDDSPRAIAQAVARVAEFVNRQREQAGGALVSRRQHASARFRNQRMVSSASQHTNGSAGSTTSNDHCSDHDDDDDDDDDDDGDGDGGEGNGGSRGGTSDRHRSHRSGVVRRKQRQRHGGEHARAHCTGARPATNDCPSSHYYIDAQGRLRARRTWWLYMQLRRFVSHLLPGLKRDSNTFLCAAMISNTTLIVVLFVVRLVINEGLLDSLLTRRQQRECQSFSSNFLDFFAFSLIGNVLLCVPAFNLSMCKLFQRVQPVFIPRRTRRSKAPSTTAGIDHSPESTPGSAAADVALTKADEVVEAAPEPEEVALAPVIAQPTIATAADGAVVHDEDHPKLRKTYLFTLCEVLVILQIPYLLYLLLTVLLPGKMGNGVSNANKAEDIWSVSARCSAQLPWSLFLVFLFVQVIGAVSYVLRWRQIILFHRLHEHFFFQRGCVPGIARFEYIESSFRPIRGVFASKRAKQIHAIKARLYRAAKYGDLDAVRTQLDAAIALDGPDFAQRWYDPDNEGIAWWLSFGGKCQSARRFSRCQRNPLHVAVTFDHPEVVQELLSGGLFDLNQLEKMEVLQLNVSWIYRFFFEIIPMLRNSNYARHKTRLLFGPVGLFCSTLLSPLHVAVSMGNTDMVLLLLRYGADANLPAYSSHHKFATPPLFWAINRECTRLLLDADANPLFVPGNGYFLTAFEVARLVGNHAVAREMEKYGGDVALTPLHDASSRGFKNEVRFYLEHGASPNSVGEKVTGYYQRTPLHWAAIRGQTKALKLLLRFGAEVDARDAFGRTPLIWACVLNRVKAVELLLRFGADPNIRDSMGDPLLCICAAGTCSSPSSTSSALSYGGDRERNRARQDAQHDRPCGVLEFQGTNAAARTIDAEILDELQRHGINIHATREVNGDTALHVALRKNNEATAILLVRAGISLTAMNFLGQRAMDCTSSPTLRYAIKKEAGHRDVMISYCHSHRSVARKVRDALEAAHVTTWIDSMDPSGITGGSVWRQEIAQGIRSSALVLAILTRDYPLSQWCMKELAFAKMHNVPIVAIQCEDMTMTEELQVYLWTRQIVDFRSAFVERTVEVIDDPYDVGDGGKHRRSAHALEGGEDDEHMLVQDPRDIAEEQGAMSLTEDGEPTEPIVPKPRMVVRHEYDEDSFRTSMRLLLDGIHDQIEEHRVRRLQRQKRQPLLAKQGSTGGGGKGGPNLCRDDSDDNHDDDDDDDVHGASDGEHDNRNGPWSSQTAVAKCDILADQLAFAEDRGKQIVPLLLSLQSIDLAKRVISDVGTIGGFAKLAQPWVFAKWLTNATAAHYPNTGAFEAACWWVMGSSATTSFDNLSGSDLAPSN
ncbi:hypothetical protein ATCC90586_008439 [Pythium insidiosum]|nr:hypothetical protein ATCC90586_008439 [Pythium insidiosum]